MGKVTGFVYSEAYLKYDFGPTHPFKPIRERYTLDLLKELEVFDEKAKYYEARMASEEELTLVHSKSYVDFVKKMSEKGYGLLDYGDTPATKGIYEAACFRVGGSLVGADLIMKGEAVHAFNPGGGLHHAKEGSAAGFCVFNDIAVTIRYLQKRYGLKRIAVVDIDGHHGDGTQQIFYSEPILTISFHRYGLLFYPGTGSVNEIGIHEGKGYSVNVPLPAGTFDEAYLYAFHEIVPPLLRSYKPEIIINQFGVDSHYEDPLVGLALTTDAYREIAQTMHKLAHEISDGRYLILGGGGYEPRNVSRCWAVMFTTVSEVTPKNQEKYRELFDKKKPEKNEQIFKKVKETVEELKRNIFPIHNL
ncbi:acetoin utilization protein AcuC [Candidatus Bathyarchaeota archaeon]|nr:MAG: acetoin utilization protein AcuC [Candidatus Bathyarchaeota archaeon]